MLAGQAALEALNSMHPGSAIVIMRDDEATAVRIETSDEPDLVIPVGVSEEDVTTVVGRHAREDRREIVENDDSGRGERLRRGSNNNSGR